MIAEKERKKKLIDRLHFGLDLSITGTAFVGSYFIRRDFLHSSLDRLSTSPNYYAILFLIIIIWFICFKFFNLYGSFVGRKYSQIIFDLFKSVTIATLLLLTVLYSLKFSDVSRVMIGIFYVTDLALLAASKTVLYRAFQKRTLSDYNVINAIVIGSRDRADEFITRITASANNYKIIGCLESDRSEVGRMVRKDIQVIGTLDDLKTIVLNEVVDEVVFAMPLKMIEDVDQYMLLIEMLGKSMRILPDWHVHSLVYRPDIASIGFDDLHGIPTMILCPTSTKQVDLFIKSALDYAATLLMMLAAFPVFLCIAAAIKMCSKGPVFFKQARLGLHGRTFQIYKFRTMVDDAEERLKEVLDKNEADGPVFKISKDPRIIPFIGTILRKTSLDELPQLFNVLKGEMSLVGPRPPIPGEVAKYSIWERRRLSMKPGLTCIWQIQPGRNDISFRQWMEMDLEYIDRWSLKLDFSILWKTFMIVFAGHGR